MLTTPEIAKEYKLPLPHWIIVRPAADSSLQQKFLLQVDKGEASAIALAHEIEYKYLITDDMEARKLSLKLGLSVIGTIGVLLRAKQAGYIEVTKPYLEQIKITNFRISDDLDQTALRKAGEE